MAHTCDLCGQTAGTSVRVRDKEKGGQEYDLVFCNDACRNRCLAKYGDRFEIVEPQPPAGAPLVFAASAARPRSNPPYDHVPLRS